MTMTLSGTGGANLSPSGYCYLPNGLIIQWGTTLQTASSNSTGGYLTTSFPITFPNGVFAVTTGTYAPTELNAAISNNVVSFTTSSFVVVTQRYGGSNPLAKTTYVAIGY